MNPEDITPQTFPKYTPNPLFDGMSDYLKDPRNYQEVQRQILATIQTSCVHSDMEGYAKCPKCTEKMLERRRLLKKLGFKNPKQYMAWKEVHEEIIRRMPLINWKEQ